MHFVKQALDVSISIKNASSRPVVIAPNTLVAANSIARSIKDVKTVPSKPTRRAGVVGYIQLRILLLLTIDEITGLIKRYIVDIPNKTHKNTGVIDITVKKRSIAVTIPTIRLSAIAEERQLLLQLQFKFDIFFTSDI